MRVRGSTERAFVDGKRAFSVAYTGWSAARVMSALFRTAMFSAKFVRAQANFRVATIPPTQASWAASSHFAARYLRMHDWKCLEEGHIVVGDRDHYTVTYMLANQWPNKKYSICLPHSRYHGLAEVAVTVTCYTDINTFKIHEHRFDQFVTSLRAQA